MNNGKLIQLPKTYSWIPAGDVHLVQASRPHRQDNWTESQREEHSKEYSIHRPSFIVAGKRELQKEIGTGHNYGVVREETKFYIYGEYYYSNTKQRNAAMKRFIKLVNNNLNQK